MKVLSVKNNKNDCTFEVELSAKDWRDGTIQTRKNIAKNIQVQGFRKGHIPQAEIDKRISSMDVAMRTLEKLQNKIISDIIASNEFKNSDCIDSVNKMEIAKLEPVPVIKVSFEMVPKVQNFTLDDVSDIVLPPFKAPEVSDAMVKQQIKMMIKPDAMVSVKKDGVVAKGNVAVIDFKGYIDGKAFQGGEGKNFELEIGSKSFIDNFEDQLIGCKKGDKKDVNVTFPKDYGMKDYAGKPAKFEVVINDVKEIEYPEITKDYCKKFGMDCENMAQLENHIKGLFVQEAELRYQDFAMRVINDAISKKAKLDYYPQSLLNMHKDQILKTYQQEANRAGYKTLDQYKKAFKLDEKKFEDTLNNSAKTTLTVALVYEKLIEDYKLKVSADDEKSFLAKFTRYLGDEKKAKEAYTKNKEYYDSNILRDKLFKTLIENCKKEEPKKASK